MPLALSPPRVLCHSARVLQKTARAPTCQREVEARAIPQAGACGGVRALLPLPPRRRRLERRLGRHTQQAHQQAAAGRAGNHCLGGGYTDTRKTGRCDVMRVSLSVCVQVWKCTLEGCEASHSQMYRAH